MGISRAEQETTCRWDRESLEVTMWSADPVVWRKMTRLGVVPTKTTTFEGRESGRFYRIPLAQFRWGLKRVGRPGSGFPRRRPTNGEAGVAG